MRKMVFLSYLIGACALLALWYLIAQAAELPILPSPERVAERLAGIFLSDIAVHGAYSLWRIAAGLCLAILIGFPLGMIMGYFPRADRYLAPIVYLIYPIPKIALLPILMLLAGLGELSKILMIFLIIVFQVVVAEIFREILWPASLPKFLTAVRVAMATAISVLFFTETFGTQYGIGYFIMDAWLRVNYLDMYAGIIVLSGIGLLLFGLLDFVEYQTCRWVAPRE